MIEEAKALTEHGIVFGEPKQTSTKFVCGKKSDQSVDRWSGWYGKMRKVNVVNGYRKFTGPNTIEVEGEEGKLS